MYSIHWISLPPTLLVPGIVHAFYIVHRYNDNFEDIERGGLRYQPVPPEEPHRVAYGATNSGKCSIINDTVKTHCLQKYANYQCEF